MFLLLRHEKNVIYSKLVSNPLKVVEGNEYLEHIEIVQAGRTSYLIFKSSMIVPDEEDGGVDRAHLLLVQLPLSQQLTEKQVRTQH